MTDDDKIHQFSGYPGKDCVLVRREIKVTTTKTDKDPVRVLNLCELVFQNKSPLFKAHPWQKIMQFEVYLINLFPKDLQILTDICTYFNLL